MTEESIIKSYNEGINAVITLVKDLNHDFASQMGSLTSEINTYIKEANTLSDDIFAEDKFDYVLSNYNDPRELDTELKK